MALTHLLVLAFFATLCYGQDIDQTEDVPYSSIQGIRTPSLPFLLSLLAPGFGSGTNAPSNWWTQQQPLQTNFPPWLQQLLAQSTINATITLPNF